MPEPKQMSVINFEFPLFNTKENPAMRADKIREELEEVKQEISGGSVDILNLMLEAQDVMQASIGMVYCSLLQTFKSKRKAKAVLQILLTELNEDHIQKIDRYINERGWERL